MSANVSIQHGMPQLDNVRLVALTHWVQSQTLITNANAKQATITTLSTLLAPSTVQPSPTALATCPTSSTTAPVPQPCSTSTRPNCSASSTAPSSTTPLASWPPTPSTSVSAKLTSPTASTTSTATSTAVLCPSPPEQSLTTPTPASAVLCSSTTPPATGVRSTALLSLTPRGTAQVMASATATKATSGTRPTRPATPFVETDTRLSQKNVTTETITNWTAASSPAKVRRLPQRQPASPSQAVFWVELLSLRWVSEVL